MEVKSLQLSPPKQQKKCATISWSVTLQIKKEDTHPPE